MERSWIRCDIVSVAPEACWSAWIDDRGADGLAAFEGDVRLGRVRQREPLSDLDLERALGGKSVDLRRAPSRP